MSKYYLLLGFWLLGSELHSQTIEADDITNSRIWLDITLSLKANDKLEYFGDTGFRWLFADKTQERIYARPSVRYRLNEQIRLLGGVGLFYSWVPNNPNVFELRPWQGVWVHWPTFKRIPVLQRLRVIHLVRFEEQFSFSDGDGEFNFRARYKLNVDVNLCKQCDPPYWHIPLYMEFFFPVENDLFGFFTNRNRFGGGLGYQRSTDWGYVVTFNRFGSRTSEEDDFRVSDFVFRLSISKRLHKSEKPD